MKKASSVAALFWSSADKVITNGVALIISIILARLVEPSEYGIIATASIFTVILVLFVEPGMTSALIQKKDTDDLDYSTILSVNLVMGTVLYALLFTLSGVIANWFEIPVLSTVLKVLGLQILIGGYNSVQIAYVQRNMMFKRYFICSIVSAAVGGGIALALAYNDFGVWALVAYSMVRIAVNMVMVTLLFKIRFSLKFSKERFRLMFPFAGKMLLTKLIDQGYVEITQTIIGKVYSSTDLAFYNKGKSFPDLLISNLNLALGNVLFPFLSQRQEDYDAFKRSLRNSIRMTSFVCIPVMLGLMACAENFIEVLLTEKWLPSVPYMQLICFYYLWVPFSNVIWQSLKAIGKGNEVLKLEIIKVGLNSSTLIIFLLILDSPIAVALSVAVSYAISFFAECYVACKHLYIRKGEIFYDFIPSFVLATVMAGVVYLIGTLSLNIYIELIIQIIAGIAIYVVGAIFLRFPQVKIVLSLFNRK